MDNKNKKEIEENSEKNENSEGKEISTETKLKETEDKLLRTLAEVESQSRRFEKATNI